MSPVVVSGKGNFTPAPEGLHLGVCCEVIDLGEQELNWKGEVRMERCVQLVFQIEEEDKNGDRYEIRQRYTAKIGPKAKLGRFLIKRCALGCAGDSFMNFPGNRNPSSRRVHASARRVAR